MDIIEKLILGTAQLGLNYGINNSTGMPGFSESIEILRAANENGIRYLDTAEAYGDAQEVIGKYHQSSNNKFYTITKLTENSIHTFGDISTVVKKDRELLQVDTIYGYLFHNLKLYQKYYDRFLFKELKRKNEINKIGVSVYTNEEAAEVANDNDIDIVQLPFNLLDNMNLRGEILKLLKSKGKEVHVRSVFLQGLFFIDERKLPENLKPLNVYLKKIRKLAQINRLSVKQLAILYALQNEFIDKVIIGIDSLPQLNEHIEFLKSYKYENNIDIQFINVSEKELLNPTNW